MKYTSRPEDNLENQISHPFQCKQLKPSYTNVIVSSASETIAMNYKDRNKTQKTEKII